MRVRMPLLLASAVLVLVTAAFFSPRLQSAYGARLNDGLFIFMAFAVVPSAISLVRLHWRRIQRRHADWPYSVVTLLAFLVTLLLGFWDNDSRLQGPRFGWVIRYAFEPMQQAVFAFLAFFIASAAYRALRVRTWEATLLLVSALLVMVGNAIYPVPGPQEPMDLWLLSVPAMAMQRGVILGVALGIVAQSVRILLGLERGFIGRG